jgi:sec-independent protein translocase protein TatB
MLGLGWSEMMVIAVVALIVVGPKDLPMLLRNIGRMMGNVRRMSNEFRREIDKAIAADEFKEAQKAISDPLKQTTADISREFNTMRGGKVSPSGKLKPSEPGKESVVEEIRAQAGIAAPMPDKQPKAIAPAESAVEPKAGKKPVARKAASPKSKPAAPTKKTAARKKASKPAAPDSGAGEA